MIELICLGAKISISKKSETHELKLSDDDLEENGEWIDTIFFGNEKEGKADIRRNNDFEDERLEQAVNFMLRKIEFRHEIFMRNFHRFRKKLLAAAESKKHQVEKRLGRL